MARLMVRCREVLQSAACIDTLTARRAEIGFDALPQPDYATPLAPARWPSD